MLLRTSLFSRLLPQSPPQSLPLSPPSGSGSSSSSIRLNKESSGAKTKLSKMLQSGWVKLTQTLQPVCKRLLIRSAGHSHLLGAFGLTGPHSSLKASLGSTSGLLSPAGKSLGPENLVLRPPGAFLRVSSRMGRLVSLRDARDCAGLTPRSITSPESPC